MAAISFSIQRGFDGFKVSDFTTGTLAPNAGDLEVRVNTTDTGSVRMTRKEVHDMLKAVMRAFDSGAIFTTFPTV